jgi:CTP synthase
MTKYIFITGGVLSSLGKGIAAASTATLLKQCGLNVSILKIDPYLNVDPGTMSPFEHGEVFVTYDGSETDLDLGHYERFLNDNLSKSHNFTAGLGYKSVIEQERKGAYLGKTIQVVPHISDEIKRRIRNAGKDKDILIVELGGTVGDIEGLPFLEAIRQIRHTLGSRNVLNIHVTLAPYIKTSDELKTKPTQHSVQELRRIGVTPHILMIRTEKNLPKEIQRKIAFSCDTEVDSVINVSDAQSIYQVPLNLLKEGLLKVISRHLGLNTLEPDTKDWKKLVKAILEPKNSLTIGFVGKYTGLKEAYKSLTEAFIHCGASLDTKINIKWIDSEKDDIEDAIKDVNGIMVPGGFGERGVSGKLRAIEYARVNNIPYLGICLGMQLALIEFARNVVGLSDVDSTEFNPNTQNPIIYLIDSFIDQNGGKQLRTHQTPLGGTMRLGEYECDTLDGSILQKAYNGEKRILERHRHRYEANPKYRESIEANGMIVSGESKGLIEAVELKNHPFFVGVQFHPEFTSRLQNPNKIILAFCKASLKSIV